MNTMHLKGEKRRKLRIRKKLRTQGSSKRLVVFRSNRYLCAQLIDDEKKKTIVSVSEKELTGSADKKLTKSGKASVLGALMAEKAKKIESGKMVFDRSGYKYHGRIKAFAEAARKGGLQF